ncbi:response regulator [Lactobacillus plantarum JDM1] [Lactiplantibacillus mudanjiangensis]|uniref:Response regulator [Lactobacillus plantarum JDM1] n=2 Tax=Lactiplantibacillus mudanjiangensis TaxID=1296538 RepID=A0A660E7Q9_9LACO|nr:response regulator [Lactobacillus plantarum JDM1] [Lactiplantibacillus mudanjiangensis]VDG24890.1 response regulator [Lactobacillus plantarum JDM1] [Lactiplantibacillus mudanjiangensis]VDG28363.1 response regulator [Lactobacillus plantarum JDM1] [Lactiplantibacillus mudanjiangensis]VDG32348.1 response regulator [Lactobacillus plantarum JDM1] [Lactiplantibacillus mudanjiangensis]
MDKILVVDDEPAIVTLLSYNLKQAGYEVVTATNGKDALELGLAQSFTCILLDLMLPQLDGMEVTKRLRQEKVRTPIIIVTAKNDEFDKVFGLELGADDYITKPFSPREVLARIKAVIRRAVPETVESPQPVSQPVNRAITVIGDLRIDQDKFQVTRNGEKISLTPKEFELLVYFIEREGRVLSRDAILNHVWGYDYASETRIVDIHISHLREKIELDPKKPRLIRTVRGFGYEFVGEDYG